MWEFLLWCSGLMTPLVSMEAPVWSPALCSWLRVQHCHSCGVSRNSGSDSIPFLWISTCHRGVAEKEKKCIFHFLVCKEEFYTYMLKKPGQTSLGPCLYSGFMPWPEWSVCPQTSLACFSPLTRTFHTPAEGAIVLLPLFGLEVMVLGPTGPQYPSPTLAPVNSEHRESVWPCGDSGPALDALPWAGKYNFSRYQDTMSILIHRREYLFKRIKGIFFGRLGLWPLFHLEHFYY